MVKTFFKSLFRFFSFAVFPALFFSCAASDSDSALADETPTLRYTATSLYEATVWTEEVELDRLTADISAVEGISSKLKLSPLIVLAGKVSDSDKVLPELKDFGSLDTSLISSSLREMLFSFCDAVAKYKDADSFFSKDCLYSLALFYADFNRIFGDCFELNKVEEIKNDTKSESKKEAENKQESDSEKNSVEEKSYFSSFVLGQPFLDGIYYEVPVKFFSKKACLTLSVFCAEVSGSWKIDQIQICDWEIF